MNALKEKISGGETAFGFWGMLSATFAVEVAAGAGYDYVCLDLQHGLISPGELPPLLQAVRAGGSAPLARVEKNDPASIGRVLDWGASGVIVPLVNDAGEAAAAAESCRYPPRGRRSYGPVRAAEIVGSADPEELEDSALCLVMVETREGLGNVAEIASTEGVDGIYIGPADLGLGLGIPPKLEIEDPEHLDAIKEIKAACDQASVVAGIHSEGARQAKRHAGAGFDLVTVRSDHGLLSDGIPRELKTARGRR